MNLLLQAAETVASEKVPQMELSSWLMLFFAILVLLGGLLVCIRVAVKVGRRKREEGTSAFGGADD